MYRPWGHSALAGKLQALGSQLSKPSQVTPSHVIATRAGSEVKETRTGQVRRTWGAQRALRTGEAVFERYLLLAGLQAGAPGSPTADNGRLGRSSRFNRGFV